MTTGLKCPKCGKNTLSCRYVGDYGGVDYLDKYEAHCSSCGYHAEVYVSGGSPLGANWVTKCPFCGKPYTEHEEYQRELDETFKRLKRPREDSESTQEKDRKQF